MTRTAAVFLAAIAAATPPHLVVIVVDDAGVGDWLHNSTFNATPTLDRLARDGCELTQLRTLPLCSPSRAALMTGAFPYRYGLQHGVVKHGSTAALPGSIPTLAERLPRHATRAVGKWHLGMARFNNTPAGRGFGSFYGFYNGEQDYYDRKYCPKDARAPASMGSPRRASRSPPQVRPGHGLP